MGSFSRSRCGSRVGSDTGRRMSWSLNVKQTRENIIIGFIECCAAWVLLGISAYGKAFAERGGKCSICSIDSHRNARMGFPPITSKFFGILFKKNTSVQWLDLTRSVWWKWRNTVLLSLQKFITEMLTMEVMIVLNKQNFSLRNRLSTFFKTFQEFWKLLLTFTALLYRIY